MTKLKAYIIIISISLCCGMATTARAQVTTEANVSGSGSIEADAGLLAEIDSIGEAAMAGDPKPEASAAAPENTLNACRDTVDNDLDSYVDCADQDCSIYAICAQAKNGVPEQGTDAGAVDAGADTIEIFERGKLCRDGIDNDNNGMADCHDTKCQSTRYCRKEMYEYPYNPVRAPGVFFQTGFGVALPNWNWKDVRVNSEYGNRIPFDPDTGGMFNFKVGVLPIPWVGVGMNMNLGGTFASNRADFISIADDDTRYKYDGYKVFGHVGAFVRLQYPTKRFTAYLDVAGGSSFARYKWRVYDGAASWDDISGDWDDDWEDDSDEVEHDTRYKQSHHFALVLEPGFDFFVVERKMGIGMHAWLPVYASSNGGMDNIGILFNITYTPTWREPRRLKEEYK